MVRNLYFLLLPLLFTFFSHQSSAQLPGCATSVTTFPYFEGFETSLGVWSNVLGDDFDWTRDSGGTPTANTGPTTGSNSIWYMYIETSGTVGTGDFARLVSACFDFTGLSNPKLKFDYHMFGAQMGSLDVEITTDGVTWTNIWSLSGNQTNNWFTASVSLAAYGNQIVGLRFVGTDGASFTGDAAIDNIEIYNEQPMQYASSLVTQATTSPIENCSSDKEILRVEIVTTGQLTPINASQFVVRTDGSTLPLSEIDNIDVYYTGASNVFATTNLFGSALSAAVGIDVLVNGNQTLLEGTNYFWVCYDVAVTATIGNSVDATCQGMTIGAINQTPTVTNPSGNRQIIDCARACPTQTPIFLENFESPPIVGVTNSSFLSGSGSGASNHNATFIISGSFFGWFNVQDGAGPFQIYNRRIDNLYVGCETTVTYWMRGQDASAGAMANVNVTLYDDNNAVVASTGNYLLTPSYTQFTHTFTSNTPGVRFTIFYNSVGGPGRDLVIEDILVRQCCDMPILLPAELTAFNSSCKQETVELNWRTESEMNNDYFTVERSRDGFHFEQVATIKSYGNSTSAVDYQWVDHAPLNGMAYYQLSQTDFDGTHELLGLISEDCQGDEAVEVFPNPFENTVKIQAKTNGSYTLVDISGKVVLSGEFGIGETLVNTAALSAGTYFIDIQQFISSTRQKLIKW